MGFESRGMNFLSLFLGHRVFELPYRSFKRRYNKNNGSTAWASQRAALKEGL